MYDIKSMNPVEIGEILRAEGEKPYRAKQVFRWLYRDVPSFDEMTDLSGALRTRLSELFSLSVPEVRRRQVSSDGTEKLLLAFPDGEAVETVLMQYEHGNTVCISTQVGCRQGCAFCASTRGGLVRNLTAGEMVDEVLVTERETGKTVSNIVLMGIGEPLDNFDNVVRFLELIGHPDGRNIGMRHISVSTCGTGDGIPRLADAGFPVTLSVSLHAPDDETRSRLLPANRDMGISRLLSQCDAYFNTTGRRVSYEYALIDGVNDSDAHARALAALLTRRRAHINLIPLNPIGDTAFAPSPRARVAAFSAILEENGLNATVRRRMGRDIDAACGQLRRSSGDA
ncbi:23S rRNA (adenine(2503)-C(2))-methyltransferase RlmN [Oscillospiraceae bacterium OttesenSCG-928-G22]|nr:23S rRNA (adenine(2503)-C(2))-methyltransferase RlmN [Oscillospiraceae bacterium OttesenSCG-928-G22]